MTYEQFLYYGRGVVYTIVAIMGVLVTSITLVGMWKIFVKKWFSPIRKLAEVGNSFASKVLPSLLKGFEDKGFVPEGTVSSWLGVVTSSYLTTNSPKKLNKKGLTFLDDSGIKKIIDSNLPDLLATLEKRKPDTGLGVEEGAFYVLNDLKNQEVMRPVRNYLYNNPNLAEDWVIYAGSFYLRDKYLDVHSEVLKGDD